MWRRSHHFWARRLDHLRHSTQPGLTTLPSPLNTQRHGPSVAVQPPPNLPRPSCRSVRGAISLAVPWCASQTSSSSSATALRVSRRRRVSRRLGVPSLPGAPEDAAKPLSARCSAGSSELVNAGEVRGEVRRHRGIEPKGNGESLGLPSQLLNRFLVHKENEEVLRIQMGGGMLHDWVHTHLPRLPHPPVPFRSPPPTRVPARARASVRRSRHWPRLAPSPRGRRPRPIGGDSGSEVSTMFMCFIVALVELFEVLRIFQAHIHQQTSPSPTLRVQS